ncbi:MAG: alpha/beta hydrolase family protein [Polyangiales bacterium]
MRSFFRVLGIPVVLFAAGACSSGATSGGFDKTDNVGLGGDCDGVNVTCRPGLTCTSSKCAATGTTKEGDPCTIGAECASGICGPSVATTPTSVPTPAKCGAAGTGAAGDGCGGDADCGKGLRCGFDGTSFFPHCVAEGKTDTGGDCVKNTDCLQGLVCTAGKCSTAVVAPGLDAKGVPPFIPGPSTWAGAKCDENVKTGITALFHVPRASDPPTEDFYRLPFPNDAARNKATGKVSFANHPHDTNPAIGFDAVKLYLDALESEPFGNYPTVYFRFDGEFIFDTVTVTGDDPQTRIVDLTEGPTFGQRQGILAFYTNGRNKYICQNFVAVRPSFGAPLKPGGTYAVIMKKGVVTCATRTGDKCTSGDPAKQHPDFTAMVGAAAPSDAGLKDAYDSYAPLRKWMTNEKVKADDLLVASVFTVGDPTKTATKLRASVRAATAPAAGDWVKCGSGTPSPCPQADAKDNRACGADNPDFDEYHSLIDMPVFQQGTAPYLTSKDGGAIDGSAATIASVRTEKVCAALTVPKGTAPASGWPVAIYAHGTGGSFRSHAADGSAKTLSKIDLGGGTTAGFAVLGIDQVQHGTRRGGSTMSPNDLFFNFANPAAARYNAQQGAADQHTLVRLAETLGTAGGVKLDGTKIVYWGHSQGATEGALFLANDTSVKGAVLSGEGASLIDALTSKTKPVDIKDSLWIALSESSPGSADLWHPVLSLLQSWADPADPLNYASMSVRVAGPHHVFQPFGVKEDNYTPWSTQMAFTLAGGLAFVGPALDAHGFMSVASAEGNVTVGTAKVTAAMRQYTAASGRDGHFVAFDVDQAKTDLSKFLARAARGEVPKIPE